MDQIKVSETTTNQDFLTKTTSEHGSITETSNILQTLSDLAELSTAPDRLDLFCQDLEEST